MKIHIIRNLSILKQELRKEILYLFSESRPRRILFDHLPKCGGSTLSTYLEAHYPRRKIFSVGGNPITSVKEFKALSRYKRYRYDLIKGHLSNELIDYVHSDCLNVTVFREPVDRIISYYYSAKSAPAHYLYSKIMESEMNLEEFATSDLSAELRNWYTTHFSGLNVSDAEKYPEESVAKAAEVVLKRYDIIGFLDDFSSFAKRLQNQAKFRYEYQDKRVNVTQDRPSLNNISPSTSKKIEEINHLDIDLYRKIREAIG